MSKSIEICPIIKFEKLNNTTYDVTIKTQNIAKCTKPGQFIHIKCDNAFLRRPISICDINGDNLRFIFEVRGEGTAFLATLKVGDSIDVLGPLGSGIFNIDEGKGKEVVFVGGGIGVFPLLLPSKLIKDKSNVVLGFRNRDAVLIEEDFKNASSNLIITTDDGSYGEKGFVTTPLEKLINEKEIGAIFACGPLAMLRNVKVLAEKNDIYCEVSMEERMGCGIGACLVCACETEDGDYLHVCKNGPVFDSREVKL